MAVGETWLLSKQYGEPDFVIKSEPYTMAAHGQDVWWKPLTAIPITEARWGRAVEMRPCSTAGRKISHHACARLEQEDPSVTAAQDPRLPGPGLFKEWRERQKF